MAIAIRSLFIGNIMDTIRNKEIKALIIDMDGVIWKRDQPLGDLRDIFDLIHSQNLLFTFATNNSTKTRQQYQEKLHRFGIEVKLSQIITSSTATVFPTGGPVYVIGENGLIKDLSDAGFYQSEEKVLAVVAGLDSGFTFKKLSLATSFIRSGAAFYGTNPDRSFPSPEGITPGAGSILAAIEAATDKKPIISG